jgi:hypothetical protein
MNRLRHRATTLLLFVALLCLSTLNPQLSTSCWAQLPNTSGLPGLKTGKTLWVDGTNGSNSTAKRGRADKPYLTIAAATTAAASGDTVQVRSGNYPEFVILKNGVALAFDPGAKFLHTSGTGTCLWDGGVAVTCTISGVKISASGAGQIDGLIVGNASSDITIDGDEITTTTTDGQAMNIAGTVRANIKKVNGYTGILVGTGGKLTYNGLTVQTNGTGTACIYNSGGTSVVNVGTIKPPAGGLAISNDGGTSTVDFQSIDDSALSASATIGQTGGTLNLNGGKLARTTTGNGITVSGGTCNIQNLDITGTFSGADVALAQSGGGTINITPAVHFPSGETSGTITRKNFFGVATTAAGNSLTGLTGAADKLPYFTSSTASATTDLTSAARAILDGATSAELASLVSDETGSASGGVLVFNNTPTFTGVIAAPAFNISNNSGVGTQIFDVTNGVDANLQIRLTSSGSSPKYVVLKSTVDSEVRLGQNSTDYFFIRSGGGVEIGSSLKVDTTNGAAITKTLSATTTWDPASLASGASEVKAGVTLTGCAVGDVVTAALSTITASTWAVQACVTGANTVDVRITNNTGGTVDLASGTLRINCIKF